MNNVGKCGSNDPSFLLVPVKINPTIKTKEFQVSWFWFLRNEVKVTLKV